MIEILVFSLLVLSVICLWILIEKRTNWKFLVWFIPVLLILVSSTYYTYTSVLGYPRIGTPKEGMYYSHYVDSPRWIYLWVIQEGNIPISYKLVYSKQKQNSLEGVEEKASEGKFMILQSEEEGTKGMGDEEGEEEGGGFTLGGDISFYEWDFERHMPSKQ